MTRRINVGPGGGDFALDPNRFSGVSGGGRMGARIVAKPPQGPQPKKSKSPKVEGFRKITNRPTYDEFLKDPARARSKNADVKVKMMTPNQYLKMIGKGRAEISKKARTRKQEEADTVPSTVTKIAKQMKKGVKFDMPFADFRGVRGFTSGEMRPSFTQEGRHRALAARKLGIKRIPVMVVRPTNRSIENTMRTTRGSKFDSLEPPSVDFKTESLRNSSLGRSILDDIINFR